ncbi:MAG: NAD-dependent epimerase/dehydratase family protein [Bacteroidales bacterium]|nr:NAD-dependent epimerase/dehydratase family protein [Bacteroidales bacterium]
MKKKVLVTGSSGFIGQYFIKTANELDIVEVDLLKKDIKDIDFSDIDSVLHLAAFVHQMKEGNDEQYFKVNRDLAYQVAKKAKECGINQFILMSTVKVYGEYTLANEPWSEKSSCFPIDSYGKSKLEAENLILGLKDSGFKIAIVRSPLVYGAGVKANMLNLIKLVDKFPIIPFGGIKNKRSLVYIGNLVALIKLIIQKQASGIFIAGDQVPLSTSQLIILIAKSLNKRIKLIKAPNFIIKGLKYLKPSVIDRLYESLELDNRSTNKLLQFIPPFSTEEGISEMVIWYKKYYINNSIDYF